MYAKMHGSLTDTECSIDGAIVLLIELPFLFACCCNCAKRFQNTAFFRFFNRTLVRGILYIGYAYPLFHNTFADKLVLRVVLVWRFSASSVRMHSVGPLLVLSGIVYQWRTPRASRPPEK